MARKYAIVGPILLAVVMLFLPMSATADPEDSDTATVVITATGYIVSAPTNLVLTYIDDNAVGVDWTKGTDAENTMVRAAYGYVPADRDDGYLVYYGESNTTVDTAVDLTMWDVPVYYRLWSESPAGLWEETGLWDFIDGETVPTILQALLVVGAAALACWRKHVILYTGAFFALIFLGITIADDTVALGIPVLIYAGYMLWCVMQYFFNRNDGEPEVYVGRRWAGGF